MRPSPVWAQCPGPRDPRPSGPGLPCLLRPAGFVALVILVAGPARPIAAQAFFTPGGYVEFLGLDEWTPESLLDSVLARAPEQRPSEYGVTLQALGFARARAEQVLVPLEVVDSVQIIRQVTLISLVEAQFADRLVLRAEFPLQEDLPGSWTAADSIFRQNNPHFISAVNLRLIGQTDAALAEAMRRELALPVQQDRVEQAWAALDALETESEFDAARTILAQSASPAQRALAASVVAGFAADDGAWEALVGALLDPSGRVTAVVNQLLGSMAAAAARRVDWASSDENLRRLLAGANLSAVPTVLQVLVSTEASPSLASGLLRENGHLVLGHLTSEYSPYRDLAHRFLVQLSGQDLGLDPEAWRSWIEAL